MSSFAAAVVVLAAVLSIPLTTVAALDGLVHRTPPPAPAIVRAEAPAIPPAPESVRARSQRTLRIGGDDDVIVIDGDAATAIVIDR